MAWASLEGQVAECIDDFASGILASRRDGDQVASMKEHFLENMAKILLHPEGTAPLPTGNSIQATSPLPPPTASAATLMQRGGKKEFVAVHGPDNKTVLLDPQRCQFYIVFATIAKNVFAQHTPPHTISLVNGNVKTTVVPEFWADYTEILPGSKVVVEFGEGEQQVSAAGASGGCLRRRGRSRFE